MPITARKIVSSTLRQQIVQEIRQSILNRSLHPGERLVEREIAARLGISLTAVREAFIQLEMEGLITKKPNATTHVTELTPKEVESIFAVRHVLENYAFQQAALVASPDAIENMERLYERTLNTARTGSGFAYITSDLEWHEAVWQSTGNEYLQETLRRIMIPLFGFSSIEIAKDGFDLVKDAETHKPLLDAIRLHDPILVGKAFKRAEMLWRQQRAPLGIKGSKN